MQIDVEYARINHLDEEKIRKIFKDLHDGKDISKYAAKNGPAAKPVTLK